MGRKGDLLKGIGDEGVRTFCARGLDRAEAAVKTYQPRFSDFSDPLKTGILYNLVRQEYAHELEILMWGGYEDGERCMIGFFPEYTRVDTGLFPIKCVEISHNPKFSRSLTHRDYLGSVLGLGITREKTGDILMEAETGRAWIFAEAEVAEYIAANLEYVGHTKVKAAVTPDFGGASPKGQERRLTVSSLRLDSVLSGAFNLSRGKVGELIKGGKAFVNRIPTESLSKAVAEGDTLTLRGTGKVKIVQVGGTTKRDRIALVVEVFK